MLIGQRRQHLCEATEPLVGLAKLPRHLRRAEEPGARINDLGQRTRCTEGPL
jgi:hypothetical protein